jgi:hypothetical protein
MGDQTLQQHTSSMGVDAEVFGNLVHALAHADAGRQVDYAVDPVECRCHVV